LKVGGEDGPTKVNSFKDMAENYKTNINKFQVRIFKKLFDMLIKKKTNDEMTFDKFCQTSLLEDESGKLFYNSTAKMRLEIDGLQEEIVTLKME
jgi:hypothetical protein